MAVEFLKGILHRKPLLIDENVTKLLLKGYLAEADGDIDSSRVHYGNAASRARIIYELAPAGTPKEIANRTMHAQIAFDSLFYAGETDESLAFAKVLLVDPMLPPTTIDRIKRVVEAKISS